MGVNQITPNPLAKFFEQAYGKKLADEEVVEYKDRAVKFFSLLIEIDQKSKRKGDETKTV